MVPISYDHMALYTNSITINIMQPSIEVALSVAHRLSVRPFRALDFLEIEKPQKLLI